MPYLKSPYDAAAALGATSGGNQPYNTDARFASMLEGSTAQLERLLGTQFSRAGHIDTFVLDPRFVCNIEQLRLAAGFVDPASVVVTDCYGDTVNSDKYELDAERGVVTLLTARGGRYRVQYNAGFAHGSDNVFIDTPEWLRSLVDLTCTIWLRSVGTPRAIEGMSLGQQMSIVYRQVAGAVYGRYDRPRSPAHFPHGTSVVEPF